MWTEAAFGPQRSCSLTNEQLSLSTISMPYHIKLLNWTEGAVTWDDRRGLVIGDCVDI